MCENPWWGQGQLFELVGSHQHTLSGTTLALHIPKMIVVLGIYIAYIRTYNQNHHINEDRIYTIWRLVVHYFSLRIIELTYRVCV